MRYLNVKNRQYEAIPEVEMDAQIQVDWGQTKQKTRNKEEIKLYFISFVLSHSRYKYLEWLDWPFTTQDTIRSHENAPAEGNEWAKSSDFYLTLTRTLDPMTR